MNERIKAMPFSVILSVIFLLVCCIAFLFFVPQLALYIAFIIAFMASSIIVINYWAGE